MTTIRLQNTKTRQREDFVPIDPQNVRLYLCGPTVYDRAHLGNSRNVLVFDVLFRLLRHVYGAEHVTYVRNFTDVDDKINARAAETGREIGDITAETIGWYHDDMDALGALRPTHEPRATAYIAQMIAMISDLIAKGHAYEAEGHALFAVESYADYGKLSGRSVDDMIAGARVEVAPYKRNPMDFVLWKPSGDGQPGWDSPWGYGRPGWHIECSAMAHELLGETFDIHAGGNDLMFPHHENEIAQSACAHPTGDFACYWIHNEMLQVEGKKMSKSLGNFFTVRDLLDQGIPGEVIRLVMLGTHYGKTMDWTDEKATEAKSRLRKWATKADGSTPGAPPAEIVDALADDLNTHEAIVELDRLYKMDDRPGLIAGAALLGIDLSRVADSEWAMPFSFETSDGSVLVEGSDYQPTIAVMGWGHISDDQRDAARRLVSLWLRLRREAEWQKADELRGEAGEVGVRLSANRSDNNINNGIATIDYEFEPGELGQLVGRFSDFVNDKARNSTDG